ncbi:MAG TPA: ribosome silencing factor [Clostridiales bacterium]|nr:ribosome silencing factor [Clostridiales bacterium]
MIQNSSQLAQQISKIIDKKKGQDICVMDIHAISSFADYFVIAHGSSVRQVKAIADEIQEEMQKQGVFLDHMEGYDSGRWILLDYLSVVVHLFVEEERRFYDLERIWKDAVTANIDNL